MTPNYEDERANFPRPLDEFGMYIYQALSMAFIHQYDANYLMVTAMADHMTRHIYTGDPYADVKVNKEPKEDEVSRQVGVGDRFFDKMIKRVGGLQKVKPKPVYGGYNEPKPDEGPVVSHEDLYRAIGRVNR